MQEEKSGQIISDEMNLGEFPLTSIADRVPKGVDALVSVDEIKHPLTGEALTRRITVRGQDPYGLPTAKDEEILMGCLKATSESGFKSRRVEINPAGFMRDIRWKTDGPAYKRWKKGMDRWSTVSVESEDAYWHRGKKKPVRDIVGIIDRWQESGHDRITGLPERAFFVWGDFMWESFNAGNLKNIDFDFWLDLDGAITRRLFRFLDKKHFRRERLIYDLKDFAVNKLGMSRKNSNGQIKDSLKDAHEELETKKFCRAEYVGKGKEAKVVYHSLKPKEGAIVDPLEIALKERGVRGIKKLLKGKDSERVKSAIKNFDHRNKMGEKRKGGWLHDDIAADKPYDFRDDYVSDPEAGKKNRGKIEEQRRRSNILGDSNKKREEERAEFEQYFSSLNETAKVKFREESIKKSKAHGRFLRNANPLTEENYAVYLESAMFEQWHRIKS